MEASLDWLASRLTPWGPASPAETVADGETYGLLEGTGSGLEPADVREAG